MDTLIVGDLHGRVEVMSKAVDTGYNIVFMGDYLDSFDRSIPDQVTILMDVLGLVQKDPDRYVALLGNHELSYLDSSMKASGYKSSTAYHLIHIKKDMYRYLKPFCYSHGFLISHAGVSQRLLDYLDVTLEEYLDRRDFYDIGHYRGGISEIGGLYWCDWYAEFEEVEGQPQIVGHSGYRDIAGGQMGVLKKGESYNVDCQDTSNEFLLLTDDGPKIIKLQEEFNASDTNT